MVKYLLRRPVAVLMTFIALVIGGLLLVNKIPVSLLPNIDVPRIVIRINYPNASVAVLEQNVVRIIRERMVNADHLQNIESNSTDHTAVLNLEFAYGTRMDLAYISVNERLDQLLNLLPRDLERPQVIKVNTSDIPIVRVQVIPKDTANLMAISQLTEKILRKRLEQVEGVSIVDINGKKDDVISIVPNRKTMDVLGITETDLTQTLTGYNREIDGLRIKDGQYSLYVKVKNELEDEKAIATLPIKLKEGPSIPMNKVARILTETQHTNSFHLFNGKDGLVITIQKKADSRMNELVPKIKMIVRQFEHDYPQVDFALTQDQTFLLHAGIDNLQQDVLYGGLFTIMLLFMFLGNWRSPLLMSISIPVSLIITFIFFYLFDISFNIISLSGLALAVGMLIDNSIVVLDSIIRKRREGHPVLESSVAGTNVVVAPVISQVLTTVAVYAPLILLSDMAGALVFDQAIGLTISLGVSLMVAFVLVPQLYKLFSEKQKKIQKEDTVFYNAIARSYHRMIDHILKHKLVYFFLTLAIMPVGILLAMHIEVTALPAMKKKESLVLVNWNSPIDGQQNYARIKLLQNYIQPGCELTESEVGINQFLLQHKNSSIEKAEIYFKCRDESARLVVDRRVMDWIKKNYPTAKVQIIDAPNAFTQLFSSSSPFFEARFKSISDNRVVANSELELLLSEISSQEFSRGVGFDIEPNVSINLDDKKMAIYGLDRHSVELALQQQFGTFKVAELNRFGDIQTVNLRTDNNSIEAKLASTVVGQNGVRYPLRYFLSLNHDSQSKNITGDNSGAYKAIQFDDNVKGIPQLRKEITQLAKKYGFSVDFSGRYYQDKTQLSRLWLILAIVLLLLYFILSYQYENLIQPLIVMLTIPLGITGGMFLLWLTGGTLDVMAATGFIVILGLIVDDPILKIDTLNRLSKEYAEQGFEHNDQLLKRIIHEAGTICLKPLLMVSLTTTIALLPILFIGGIGNELQKPLAIVVIGGLTIGTFFTTWFIPLAYWYINSLPTKKLIKNTSL